MEKIGFSKRACIAYSAKVSEKPVHNKFGKTSLAQFFSKMRPEEELSVPSTAATLLNFHCGCEFPFPENLSALAHYMLLHLGRG